MNFSKGEMAAAVTVIAAFMLGIIYYPQMPDLMASHWDVQGQVDGYIAKFWGVFLLPFILFAMFAVFIVITRFAFSEESISSVKSHYDGFIATLAIFFLYLYILTLIWNMGTLFSMIKWLLPAFGTLIYYCGVLFKNIKRNKYLGIRTPWTVNNDIVWEKTHKLGSKMFKGAGILLMVGTFFSRYALYLFGMLVIVCLYLTAFSFLEYRKQFKSR